MELVFVIDSSESVGPENFEIIKDFVIRLVDRTTVGRNATRIGLVLYSLDVHLEFNLARYTMKQDIKHAIRKIPYMGEGTYTGTAIRKATQEAFFNARRGVRKVAIVITDGQTDKREPVKLDLAVREAHAANIEMYALGIVNASDPTQAEFLQELNLIASDPDSEHMYLIDDFNTLPGDSAVNTVPSAGQLFTTDMLKKDAVTRDVPLCLSSFLKPPGFCLLSTGISTGQPVLRG